MDFDATSLYPSAVWDEKSVYLKKEMVYLFEANFVDQFVKKPNTQSLKKSGAFLKRMYFNPQT